MRGQHTAHFRRAREGELAHCHAARQHATNGARGARQHAENTCGNTSALRQLGQRQRRQRRLLRRLNDDGATRCQRRCHFARNHGGREVPRCDGSAHAHGLLGHHNALVTPGRRHGGAIDAAGFFCKPLHIGSCIGNLTTRLGQRLALLCRHDLRQIFLVGHQQLKPFVQHSRTLIGGLGLPLHKSTLCSIDGRLRFRLAQLGHGHQQFASSRVVHINRGAVSGGQPLTINQALAFQQARVA